MRKPWLDWSGRGFFATTMTAFAVLVFIRFVLRDMVESTVLTILLLIVHPLGVILLLYITFSWTREYDRRNPRP